MGMEIGEGPSPAKAFVQDTLAEPRNSLLVELRAGHPREVHGKILGKCKRNRFEKLGHIVEGYSVGIFCLSDY